MSEEQDFPDDYSDFNEPSEDENEGIDEMDQYLDENIDENAGESILQPGLQSQTQVELDTDDETFHVVPDRVRSLENYINLLSESISVGSISQSEFDSEILKTTYYLDILTKKYNIVTEDKQKIIEDARILRKEAIEAFKTGAISEEKFNEIYTSAIRTEYSILKSSEIGDDSIGSRVNLMEDLTIEQKLKKLEKLEDKQIRNIAKKHRIQFPEIPMGKTASEIDTYYTKKITGIIQEEDEEIELYLQQQLESKKLVDYHTTSFEVSKIFYNATTKKPDFEFKLVQSIRGDIEKIKRDDAKQQLLDPQEKAYVDRLNELKSMLRRMNINDLIKCADVQLYKLLTYIEKLRSFKQYAFKFKSQPSELDIEGQILSDNEFYKLPAEKLLTGYDYSRPNIYTIDDDESSPVITLTEIGNLGYLALKEGKNPLRLFDSNEDTDTETDTEDYFTVVPFQDELYSQLKSQSGNYTEIVEVWEIHLDFIDGSKKTLRYTSFEDFLLVFKKLLITKSKSLKKIEEEQVSDLLTKRSNIKYSRLKPRSSPFLLGQKTETKSFDELRYEYYTNYAISDSAENTDTRKKFESQIKDKISLKKASTPGDNPDITILLNKIMQIEYYLIFKMDKQQKLSTSQISPRKLLQDESEIYKMRELGLEKLINYISLTEPGADEVIKDIESDIFSFSSENYTFNIKKVIFIFDNFPEKMEDIILSKKNESGTGQSSIKDLLLYETPVNLPPETIRVKTDEDKTAKIEELLNWKPDTELYNLYESELTALNHDFKEFTRLNPELRNIEFNQIMSEYCEKIQWQRSLINYNKLEVPSGMIELNFRLRFLLRQRNRLPSRRIFKLATISTRIDKQEELERTFGVCKIKDYKKFSLHTERIIYSLSKTPEDYMYYNYIANSKFKLICDSLIAFQESFIIDEFQMISILIKFIINNGDFSKEDIEKLVNFSEKITEDNLEMYISTLKRDELRAHAAYKISQSDSGEITKSEQGLYSDASNIAESEAETVLRLELLYQSNNTYVPPVVYDVLPDDERPQRFFLINGQYICGGFFPPFVRWDSNLVPSENYTRNDLLQLSGMLAIPVSSQDTNYQIYEKIREFIDEKESFPDIDINLVRTRFNPEITSPYEYLKIPIKAIIYTIRPRYGVPLPGEVYNVILDKTNVYGVPFKFQNGIPVYSLKLKELVENKFVIIEGPSLYEETSESNFMKSNYYILIEYTDQRGLKIFFKEGVAKKRIIQKNPGYSACDRFNNQISCNDPNSYSLELKGKRYKCTWKKTCVIFDDTKLFEDFTDFSIDKVTFSEAYKQTSWASALEQSLKYIEDKIVSEKLSSENIDILKKSQKQKLYNYYIKLSKHVFTKDIGETSTAISTSAVSSNLASSSTAATSEAVHDKSLLSDFIGDILKPDVPRPKIVQTVQEGYVKFTIYKHKKSESVTSVDNIVLNENYSTYINGTYVNIVPNTFIPNENAYICTTEDGGTLKVNKTDIYKVEGNTLKVVPIFCMVKKEDFPFLTKRIGYYWIHKEKLKIRRYGQNGEPEILTKEEDIIRYDVPSNFIEPTDNLPDLPIITRDNIFDAMYKTAFNTMSNSVDPLIYSTVEQFNATLEAKKFAVINRVDLKKIIKIGTIGMDDIQKMSGIDYVVNTITPQQILKIITDAIANKDISVLTEYYLMGVKAEIDKDILKEAKVIIDSYKTPVEEDIIPVNVKPQQESGNVVSYVIRRPGKSREEVE
jgi:hypothetical protein